MLFEGSWATMGLAVQLAVGADAGRFAPDAAQPPGRWTD